MNPSSSQFGKKMFKDYFFFRFGQRDTSILMTSSVKNPAEQLRGRDSSNPAEIRSVPHSTDLQKRLESGGGGKTQRRLHLQAGH